MDATIPLLVVAACLIVAVVATTIRGTGSPQARRTWLLVAAIFVTVSAWLRLTRR